MAEDKITKIKKVISELGEDFITKVTSAHLKPAEMLTVLTVVSCRLVESLAKTLNEDPRFLLEAYASFIAAYIEEVGEDTPKPSSDLPN